ncbi:hypothetical protein DFJ63DRAFT_313345 [Scheffersomyces coipomensis]|uniref:uncharacterized protein n=1 Tax=Scheffersomyces coipomensis TaxID=1788519 RepID=UPI00315C875D
MKLISLMIYLCACLIDFTVGLESNKTHNLEKEVRGCRLEKEVKMEDLMSMTTEFGGKNMFTVDRRSGLESYNDTGKFILEFLSSLNQYYDIYQVPYEGYGFWSNNNYLQYAQKKLRLFPYFYSLMGDRCPYVNKLEIIDSQGCIPEEFDKFPGNTSVVVQDGGCDINKKTALACYYGATSLLVNSTNTFIMESHVNHQRFHLLHDSTFQPFKNDQKMHTCLGIVFPSFKIRSKDLDQLMRENTNSTVSGELIMSTLVFASYFTNIFAVSKSGNSSNVVLAGANYDSFANSVGMNDNASGVIALLNIAKYLTKFQLNNKVSFAFWGSKESYPQGHSVPMSDDMQDNVKMYLDYDTIGSPNYVPYVYVPTQMEPSFYEMSINKQFMKENHISATHADFFSKNNITWKPFYEMELDRSHFRSIYNVPIGGLTSGSQKVKSGDMSLSDSTDDPCRHLPCDTDINSEALFMNTRAAAFAIGTYARNLTGFENKEPKE